MRADESRIGSALKNYYCGSGSVERTSTLDLMHLKFCLGPRNLAAVCSHFIRARTQNLVHPLDVALL